MTSDPDFKATTFLKSNFLKDKVTIAQEETISNIWNGTLLVTLIDL